MSSDVLQPGTPAAAAAFLGDLDLFDPFPRHAFPVPGPAGTVLERPAPPQVRLRARLVPLAILVGVAAAAVLFS